MAWTTEDRRRYAPAVREIVRRGMPPRLAATIDAIHPPSRVGRPRVWSTLIMLQALWHLARDGRAWRRLPAGRVPTLHHRREPSPPLAQAGRARPRPGGPCRLPPPRSRAQAAADRGRARPSIPGA